MHACMNAYSCTDNLGKENNKQTHEAIQQRQPNIQNQIWKSILRVIGAVSTYELALECYGLTVRIGSTMPNPITNAISQGDSIAPQLTVIHWAVWRSVVLGDTIF